MKIFQHPKFKDLISKSTSILQNLISKGKSILQNLITKGTCLSQEIKQYPGWKKLSVRCKDISVCQVNFRQMTVLLLLVFFLTSFAFENIQAAQASQAASLEAVQDTAIKAHKVILNEKESGYVCDPISAEIIMDEILQEAALLYSMEIADDNLLRFEETVISREEMSTKKELDEALRKHSRILVNACTIYVDDIPIGTLKTKEEAQQLLDKVKSKYIDPESSLENASFQEDVKIAITPIHFQQIQKLEEVEAELEEEQEVVEEYTLQDGDTFWSISRKYKIKMGDLTNLNPDKDPKKLRKGLVIRLSYPKSLLNVVTRELAKFEDSISYETETQNDNSMYKNESKTIREGQAGKKFVEAYIVKVNGIEREREVIYEEVILEPVNKIVAKGTKKEVTAASIARGYGKFKWPTSGRITSYYGKRRAPTRRASTNHKGIDIANSKGTRIYAAESGKVTAVGRAGGYGKRVVIDHGSRVTTLYAHLSTIKVSKGQSVSRGQLIGYMGNTGNSTGSHLHFEVRISDSPKNPLRYLN
ncbi:MAG TPA: hypothetical protein DIW17_04230 [Clostridiales bacterium]|nr:M23 family metallopeptidase [Clostridia bacterium]HCS73065.1 hypothetical protein [Clostridiales bacterium]